MPFKIYTYSDPYRLHECHFWTDICLLPHLCVAQTLANAVRDLFGDKLDSLICPIESVIQFAYAEWRGNVALELRQYTELSRKLAEWKNNGQIDDALYNTLRHNQRELLRAIRLFVELGIAGDKLDPKAANREQKVFLELLQLISQGEMSDAFTLQVLDNRDQFIKALISAADDDHKRTMELLGTRLQHLKETGAQDKCQQVEEAITEEEERHTRIVERLGTGVDRVVIHGVHQFTPLQLRLIQQLDEFGVEVIFLYNYQARYSKIYSTWNYVYRQFGVVPEADRNITSYPMIPDSRSHALAAAFAGLFNPEIIAETRSFFDWSVLFGKPKEGSQSQGSPVFVEFDNVTEFANFVAHYFDEALKESPDNPLAKMQEQVYSASGDGHQLLNIYYPDYAGDRHFLAYPVGRFFVALYRMWNPETQQLDLEVNALADCLASGLLRSAPVERLMTVFHRTQLYYEDVRSYTEFDRCMQIYEDRYRELYGQLAPEDSEWLKHLSVYNQDLVSLDDIKLLRTTVAQINSIARTLFVDDKQEGYIKLKRHFEKLEEFIRLSIPELADEAESQLVTELLERFQHLDYDPEQKATIDDLREGLYYYLRQKKREHEKWIIRNFEQIDGDVLRSRKQRGNAVAENHTLPHLPVYHFAGLSDKVMNKTADDLLPWPLTDRFIQRAYFPVDLVFQVYYASLSEYRNFLRYALFYGLCFNECDVRLSYIKNTGQDINQPYFPLGVLGLTPEHIEIDLNKSTVLPDLRCPLRTTKSPVSVDWQQAVSFLLCPYRYLMDFVLNKRPTINDKFAYRFLYFNLLVQRVWKRIENQPAPWKEEKLRSLLRAANDKLKGYFPYLMGINDLPDLIQQAENYLIHNCQNRRFDSDHMHLRFIYRKAAYYLDSDKTSWEHPYPAYGRLAVRGRNPSVIVSLHRVPKELSPDLIKAVQEYLNDTEKHECPEEWCHFCPHKTVCLKSYEAFGPVEMSQP